MDAYAATAALVKSEAAKANGSSGSLIELSQSLHSMYEQEAGKLGLNGKEHCAGIVPVFAPELLELLSVIESWPESQRTNFLEQCRTYFEASQRYWRSEAGAVASSCPLFAEAGRGLFDHRPLGCRAAPDSPLFRAVATGLQEGLADAGLPWWPFELGAALSFLLAKGVSVSSIDARALFAANGPLNRFRLDVVSTGVPIQPSADAAPLFHPPLADLAKRGVSKLEKYSAAMRIGERNPVSVLFRLALPNSYESEDELEEWWARYQENLDLLCSLRLPPKLTFEALGYTDVFHLAYNGKNVKPVVERLMNFLHDSVARPAHPELTKPLPAQRKPGKFRLGYLSWRLTDYNGSKWALGWLMNHSSDIETYAFNLNPIEDAISMKWRRLSDHYFHLRLNPAEVARFVRTLDLDALIFTDLGEDGVSLQLSLLQLARRQFTAWGHAVTSGSPKIDYYLISGEMEPVNGDEHYTEQLVRLPGSSLYIPPARPKPSQKSLEELGLPKNGFYFLAQSPFKLLPRQDKVFKKICDVSGKPLVVNARPKLGDAVGQRLRRAGVNVVQVPRVPLPDFLRIVQLADCVLDSFEFSGGITTIDTLAAGGALVSCPGEFMRGRMAIPFMKQSGVEGLLARDEEEYVALATDQNRIQTIMKKWNAAPMFEDMRPVAALDEFLLGRSGCGDRI